MKIKLYISGHDFAYEMECVLRLFFPGSEINIIRGEPSGAEVDLYAENTVVTNISEDGDHGRILRVSSSVSGNGLEGSAELAAGAPESEMERALGALMFGQLVKITGIRPPWGVLTGVRPVRFCRSLMESGLNEDGVLKSLTEDYLVEPKKARLALKTCEAGRKILEKNSDKSFSLYISIPFCPSRCLYCSFVSSEIKACLKLIPDYVRLLCEEIRYTAKIAHKSGLTLQTVYIGGGTPTTLGAGELSLIMDAVGESFDFSGLLEYTVEAGRPDTITPEKLRAVKSRGATRISVNPQTMNNRVLEEIGRNHTAEDFLKSFTFAREAGFNRINTDLIAGLPGDTLAGYADTVEKILELSPENITVHTLTVKRASSLRGRSDAFNPPGGMDIDASLDAAGDTFSAAGYIPYYMYRQKGTRGNHENTGYSKPGLEGVYNVYIMEEEHTILAAGAGAVSKIYRPNGKSGIKRVYNYKHPHEYVAGFDEILRRKDETGGLL